MAAQEFNQQVSRLAQYRPFSDEGRNLRAVLRDLVLVATAEAEMSGVWPSLAALQNAFHTLWGLDVEIDELRSVRDDLVKEGRARDTGGGLTVSAETLGELEATREQSENVRVAAFGEWEERVRTHRPDLTDEEFGALIDDLEAWLNAIIARHGVEAALVLYPENPRAQKVFDEIERLGLDFLPKRNQRIREARETALASFVRDPTGPQRRFLADRLDVSYFLTVLTLDPEASQLVRDKVMGHRVYLDTNVVYAVLGLAKPQEALSALRLLDLTRELGYEVAVTSWTIDELRTSLRRARERVGRVPLPRRELAHLLATASDERSVVTAFWAAFRDRGVKPKDFFDFYDQIDSLLEGHGIKVIDEGVRAVDQNREAIDEQLVLLDRQMGPKFKEDVVMEHDVKHRLLVERLRGAGHVSFSNARYWFLTRDGKLPPYARRTMDGAQVELPFCVATSAWLQTMRAFTPRTDDLDRTVVDLLASPFVTVRRGVVARVVEEVVGRVDQAEQGDALIATAILADTALVADIEAAKDDAERAERTDRAFEKKTSELQEKLVEADRREVDSRKAIAAATRQAEEEAAALEVERRSRLVLETALENEKRKRAQREAQFERRLDEEKGARRDAEERAAVRIAEGEKQSEEEVVKLRSEFEGFKTSVFRGVVALIVSVVAVAGAVTLLATEVVAAPGLVVATATGAVVVLLLAIRLGLGAKKGDMVATWVTIAITIAGFVWFVVDKATQDEPPTSRERKP